jgi:hypothetical protein
MTQGSPDTHIVVYLPTVDVKEVDRILARLRGVLPGNAPTARATVDLQLMKSSPNLSVALPEPRSLYIYEARGVTAVDRAIVVPPGVSIWTGKLNDGNLAEGAGGTRGSSTSKNPTNTPNPVPSDLVAGPSVTPGSMRMLLGKLRNLWVPRQTVRIDGVHVDAKEWAVWIGLLHIASRQIATIVHVTTKLPTGTAEEAEAILREFVQEYVVPQNPEAIISSPIPVTDANVSISPVSSDPVQCFVHLLREKSLL